MKMLQRFSIGLLALFWLAACSTTSVKSTEFVPMVQGEAPEQEELLMDVGVMVFDPGIDEVDEDEMDRTNLEIRRAESRYAPWLMADSLQRSGNWGVVRVLPSDTSTMDVYVDGTLLLSDGEGMVVAVTVTDATGREWYSRVYEEHVSQFAYDRTQRQSHDPFQALYNRIANDLVEYRKENVSADEIHNIRTVAELDFASDFAPEVFGDYLRTNEDGVTEVVRLPAENDPMMERIRNIRERDHLFVDTVQDYYATYARQMRTPYDAWREESYHATMALEEAERSARRRFIAGAAAIVGGIASATSSNAAVRTGGIVGVGAGAYLVRSGFERSSEAEMHIATLQEMGQSLESEVAPRLIDLENRTIRLTGTVEEQYEQWRDILVEMYETETGMPVSSTE
ncbi:MAG: hypothetical protein ACQETO_13165 [Pseudomonadota bacterium]